MSNEQIKDLLIRLHNELEKNPEIDEETRDLVRELNTDIDAILDPEGSDNDAGGAVDRANALETKFAANHPTAERLLREIADALGKIGI